MMQFRSFTKCYFYLREQTCSISIGPQLARNGSNQYSNSACEDARMIMGVKLKQWFTYIREEDRETQLISVTNTSSRVAKCQFFYTDKTVKPNFTQRKTRKSRQFWHKTNKKYTFREQPLITLIWLVYTQKSDICSTNIPQKRLDFSESACSPKLLPHPANIFTRIYPSYP